MKTLKMIADVEASSSVRTCAVSAIGTLGAQDQFDYLVGKFTRFEGNDKIMPLKSIGDSATPQAIEFLRKVKGEKLYQEENGVKYCVDLYLEGY